MFSESQKFYLKRLAALHDFKNGRKAVYLQQKKEKTWAAYDLPNTRAVDASAGLLMYHGKQYKDLEGIVADVLDIHQDAGAVMFINNSRIASGLPAFVTLDNAEAMGSIPGDKEHRQIVNVRDYLTVYGIDYDDVDVMQPERAWMTTEVSLEVPDTTYADTRTVCVPVEEDSEMGAYYEALLEAGRNLLMEDHRKIKWGDMSTAPDVKTLFRIWDEKPNLDMTVGFMELSAPEEVMGKGKAGDYMMSVHASGSRNPFGTVLSSSLVAYALSRIRFRGSKFWFTCMLITMMLPGQVIMIPQYLIYYRLGLVPGYAPLILPYFCGQAFFIYQMMQFMQGIPRDLDEAATIDGCSKYKVYSHIILPLMKPSIVTTVIIQFYWKWDDYLGPLLYLSRPQSYTVSIAIKLFADSASTTDYGAMFAMSTLSLIPVFLIFLFFNRYLVQGIGTSGLKG